jgi:hypothetical protein
MATDHEQARPVINALPRAQRMWALEIGWREDFANPGASGRLARVIRPAGLAGVLAYVSDRTFRAGVKRRQRC